ncbi:MAG: methyl-accepting chemotaxis protein, partial [Chloroflexi bacterium]|nr:methyl-accepting chemotaxis protein [Chloroflexota bacterium]
MNAVVVGSAAQSTPQQHWGWLGRLRLGQKIGLGFGISILLTAGIIAFSLNRLQIVSDTASQLILVNFRLVERVDELDLAIAQQALALRSYIMTEGQEAELEPLYTNAQRSFDQAVRDLRQLLITPQEREQLTEIDRLHQQYHDLAQRTIAAVRAKNDTEAIRLVRDEGGTVRRMMTDRTGQLVTQQEQLLASENARLDALEINAQRQLWAVGALAAVLSLLTGYLITVMVTRQVNRYVGLVTQVGQGNLSGRTRVTGADELGILGHNLNSMTASLGELTAQTRSAVASLSSSTSEIVASVAQQSSSATEQAAAIAQTTATVNEVKASADQTVQMAAIVGETANQAQRVAAEGVAA